MSNIQIIDRVSTILRSFTIDQFEMGATELAKAAGLSKSTAHRLATAMVKANLLDYDDSSYKYRLGIGLMHMGNLVGQKLSLTKVAKKHMIQLRDLTNESIMLKVVDQDQGVSIEYIETEAYLRPSSRLGQRTYLYASASSKLLLAYMLDEEIEEILQKDIIQLTTNTPTKDTLREQIIQIREKGYAASFGERVTDGVGISVPICDSSQKVVASLTIIGAKYRITNEKINEFLPYLLETGQKISLELGFNPNIPIKLGKTDYFN